MMQRKLVEFTILETKFINLQKQWEQNPQHVSNENREYQRTNDQGKLTCKPHKQYPCPLQSCQYLVWLAFDHYQTQKTNHHYRLVSSLWPFLVFFFHVPFLFLSPSPFLFPFLSLDHVYLYLSICVPSIFPEVISRCTKYIIHFPKEIMASI